MELVYLWVEDYKNIHKQGFNFSPRLECEFKDEYDADGKLKDNCELIINPKEHLENFFGENINVTAIVGENGSGKSSIFEILSSITTDFNKLDNSSFFYITYNGKIEIRSQNIDNINSPYDIEEEFTNCHISKTVKRTGQVKYTYNHINLKQFFNLCYLTISHLELDGILKNDEPLQGIEYYGIYAKNKFETDEKSIYPLYGEFHLNRFNYFQTFAISNLIIDRKYKKLLFNIFNIMEPYYIKLNYSMEELKKPHLETSTNLIFFLDSLEENYINLNSPKLKEFFTLCNSEHNIEKYIKLTFQTEQYQNMKFSTGEKTILFYLERIDFMLSELKDKSTILLFDEVELYLHPNWQKRILNIIINFISSTGIEKPLHIVINSHSPFLLSDLPKENIIFLEKYKIDDIDVSNGKQQIGNCKNESKNIIINPFGANIHTLLSHGFFMQDGLMGEFAKSKITKILNFLNGKNKFIDFPLSQIKPIIENIGEDFLKEKLLSMYDKKFPISKEEKIQELEKELRLLKDG